MKAVGGFSERERQVLEAALQFFQTDQDGRSHFQSTVLDDNGNPTIVKFTIGDVHKLRAKLGGMQAGRFVAEKRRKVPTRKVGR